MAVFSIPLEKESKAVDVKSKWQELMRHPKMTYSLVPLTTYHIPEAETFNLLGANGNKAQPFSESLILTNSIVAESYKLYT